MATCAKLLLSQCLSHPLWIVPVRTHMGYLPYEGLYLKKDKYRHLVVAAVKSVNLKPVSRVHFSFDPLHPRVKSIRDILYYLSSEKVRATNPKCTYKTEALSDRSEPTLRIHLEEGKSILFKTGNLSALETLTIMNKHVLPLVKVEQEASQVSKGAQLSAGKKKR